MKISPAKKRSDSPNSSKKKKRNDDKRKSKDYPGLKEYSIKERREYTEEEITAFLKGYIEVPRENWDVLTGKSRLKFIKTDGSFIQGGLLIKVDKDRQPEDHTFVYTNDYAYFNFKRDSAAARDIKTFNMMFSNVERVFKQIENINEFLFLYDKIAEMKKEMKLMHEKIIELEYELRGTRKKHL